MAKVYIHISNGFSLFSSSILRGKNVVAVYKDGVGMTKILTSGIPTGKEVTVNGISGSVLLPNKPERGEAITIIYQN